MEIKFERESLYAEVWSTPISTLCKKYGISDNGLRNVCIALAIPLPARGHWAKVTAGNSVVTPPLPPADTRTFFIARVPDSEEKLGEALPHIAKLNQRLAFESAPENAVVVAAELVKPHRLVAAAVPVVRAQVEGLQKSRDRQAKPRRRRPGERWEPDWDALRKPQWTDYEQRGVMEFHADALPMRVSIEAADRALRIFDALLKACEARGLLVSSAKRKVEVSVGTNRVGLRMSEKVDRFSRPAALGGVVTERRTPTGRLRIFVGDTKFEEMDKRPLEVQLNAVLAGIWRFFCVQDTVRFKAAEARERRETETRRLVQQQEEAAEAARLREEELQRQREVQAAIAERERLLMVEATSWRDAACIRAYANHIRTSAADSSPIPPALRDWLVWADSVADKLDPTSRRLAGSCARPRDQSEEG